MNEMQEQLEKLADALRDTQDRVMALEGAMRVYAHCLIYSRAVPGYLLVDQLTHAIHEIHGPYGEEFPEVVRALAVLRDFAKEVAEREQ